MRAMKTGHTHKLRQRIGMGVAEGKRDAERNGAIAQRMKSDHLSRCAWRRGGSRLDGRDGIKRLNAFVTENIDNARRRAMRSNNRQNVEDGTDGILRRYRAQPCCRGLSIGRCALTTTMASNAKVNSRLRELRPLTRLHHT